MSRRIVIAGGSGFLGRALAADLVQDGCEVTILTRSPRADARHGREAAWDGATAAAWAELLDGAAAVVNLTGRSVDCRYTEANRREIVDSRVNSVRAISEAIAHCKVAPQAWVQASSLAIYGDPGEAACDEHAPDGEGFSVEVCRAWEAAFEQAPAPSTRKVALRIGFVLGSHGGALDRLVPLARAFLGGTVGSGRQYISWLHVADMNRMFRWAIDRTEVSGTYNATGPTPVTNREFMRALRDVVGRPWSPPVPAFAVHIGSLFMGTEASLALTGRRCLPARFQQQGFEFQHADLGAALRDVVER